MNQYKILLVGDENVGKSSLIRRLSTADFKEGYAPTLGVDVSPLTFSTKHGLITFNIWDCAGNPDYKSLGIQGYGKQTDAAIIMFDLTFEITYNNVHGWIENIHNICGDIPIIVCGNKIDRLAECSHLVKMLRRWRRWGKEPVEYFDGLHLLFREGDGYAEDSDFTKPHTDEYNKVKSIPGTRYYSISSKTAHNLKEPFLDIAKQLTGHDNLVFV
uniref:Ras-related GTPase n=1 Tax=Marseillevirus LCMAC102 TaxID=2506603 RepID=A0A481YV61_9VIRU|nr:MAG: Ras-related GTPase [Marseillevirus LCMAC102]